MSQENVEMMREGLAALAGRDAEQLTDEVLADYFDPEVEWLPTSEGLLSSGVYHGYEGIRRFVTDFFAAWDEFRIDPQEFRNMGAQVAVTLRMRGRVHELEIDENWSSLCTFRNGRIVRLQAFASRDGALKAAGLRE